MCSEHFVARGCRDLVDSRSDNVERRTLVQHVELEVARVVLDQPDQLLQALGVTAIAVVMEPELPPDEVRSSPVAAPVAARVDFERVIRIGDLDAPARETSFVARESAHLWPTPPLPNFVPSSGDE